MPRRPSRFVRGWVSGLVLAAVGSVWATGCGPSSEQMVDRDAPEYKDAMKRSANAYINRAAEVKKARTKRTP